MYPCNIIFQIDQIKKRKLVLDALDEKVIKRGSVFKNSTLCLH